jgi:lauroyl/myristoyl acyltransferase
MAPEAQPPRPLSQRKLDAVYLVFFLIHVPIMLCKFLPWKFLLGLGRAGATVLACLQRKEKKRPVQVRGLLDFRSC